MAWKYSQIVHFNMVNAEAVPKASFPEKDNHYRYNILLSFLPGQKRIATFTWKCSTMSWFTLKSQLCFLLASIQQWGFFTVCGLFYVVLCNSEIKCLSVPPEVFAGNSQKQMTIVVEHSNWISSNFSWVSWTTIIPVYILLSSSQKYFLTLRWLSDWI